MRPAEGQAVRLSRTQIRGAVATSGRGGVAVARDLVAESGGGAGGAMRR
jgi:hypothetical protein